jgi:hypothetical protein
MNPATLIHNIEHLHLAALQNSKDPKLVANWDSTYIYAQGSWLGRLWTWFYRGVAFLGYGDSSEERLLQSIKKTFQVFLEHHESLKAPQMDFQKALLQRMDGQDVDEEIFHQSRAASISWQAILTCWNSFLKDENAQVLQDRLKDILDETTSSLFASSFKSYPFSHVFQLEGYLKQPLPVALLKQLAWSQELSELNQECLSAFIQQTNDHQEIPVRLFSKALKELVILYSTTTPTSDIEDNLLALKVALASHGCSIFSKEDEKHTQWVSSLEPGITLQCGTKEYTLGKKIEDNFDSDIEMYEVDGEPLMALSFARNCELLALRERLAKESWGIKSVSYIDRCCRFSVVERLDKPLIMIEWTSKEKLTEDDKKLLDPLRTHIKWYVKENDYFPEGLSNRTLGFNVENQLKCIQAITQGDNFNQLVTFVIQCAKGNPFVYRHLAKPIKKHKVARFYHSIVQNSLRDEPGTFQSVREACDIPEEAEDLAKQARELESQIGLIKKELAGHCSSLNQLGKKIQACYDNECYIGRLPRNFKDRVLEYLPKRDSIGSNQL